VTLKTLKHGPVVGVDGSFRPREPQEPIEIVRIRGDDVVLIHAGKEVRSVRWTFGSRIVDEMVPVKGWAVLTRGLQDASHAPTYSQPAMIEASGPTGLLVGSAPVVENPKANADFSCEIRDYL